MKCCICGKEFTPHQHKQKCCSQDCSRELQRLQAKAWRNANYVHKKNRAEVQPDEYALRRLNGENICMWCGNGTSAAKERFCSSKCLASFYNRLFDKF